MPLDSLIPENIERRSRVIGVKKITKVVLVTATPQSDEPPGRPAYKTDETVLVSRQETIPEVHVERTINDVLGRI